MLRKMVACLTVAGFMMAVGCGDSAPAKKPESKPAAPAKTDAKK